MEKSIRVEVVPTPKEVASMIWDLNSDEQAEMFECLLEMSGSSHELMMQFMFARDSCVERSDKALESFQCMFSSAYKYCW